MKTSENIYIDIKNPEVTKRLLNATYNCGYLVVWNLGNNKVIISR